jgi:hypothetical protein
MPWAVETRLAGLVVAGVLQQNDAMRELTTMTAIPNHPTPVTSESGMIDREAEMRVGLHVC